MERHTEYKLGQLAELLSVAVFGDENTVVRGLATLKSAGPYQLSFLANRRYQAALQSTAAAAVIVSPDIAAEHHGNMLVAENPYLTYARVSRLFEPTMSADTGVAPSAVVSSSAKIAPTAIVGPNCVIGDRVVIGDAVRIGPGCVIGNDTCVGAGCLLHANVTLYHGVIIGKRVTIHSGVVIGSDGFGFAPSTEGWVKIAQLGGVTIGDDVDIGANTTIDRGALDHTIIGNGVIIDNQVQIAHNVVIGDHTAIAGCTGIAGSTTIGKHCTLAGRSNIVGHISIADGTHITATTLVSKTITQADSYSSGTAMQTTKQWKKNAVRFGKLQELYDRLVRLEKRIK